jgi:hypothetical protein
MSRTARQAHWNSCSTVFVVAVSQASGALHQLWEEQHFVAGLAA